MITWAGTWSDLELAEANKAIELASIRLAELTGFPPDVAFNMLFGDITLEALPEVAGAYRGYVSALEPRRVQLEIGEITEKLVLHELGHVITLTVPTEISPAEQLSKIVIVTESGRAVTGQWANTYARHMGYYATKYTGYINIFYPDHQHPVNWDDGNTPTEDWCDMWLSWVTGNIAENESGDAIRKWIENYLIMRLK